MPELPDVEMFRRHLDDTSLKRKIERVHVNDPRILHELSPSTFRRRLQGNRFEESRRHGKNLLVRLVKNGWLTLHFGMTGHLHAYDDEDEPKYARVVFDFADGHLAYVNRRMLGRVGLADDAEAFVHAEDLGPDALDPSFDLDALKAAFEGRRRDIKSALMEQSVIAGIGNIYADEILFHARLHPKIRVDELSERQTRALFDAMKMVLERSIELGAGSETFIERLPDDFLLPHREKGATCPRCDTKIQPMKAGGRTTYFCPKCQPGP